MCQVPKGSCSRHKLPEGTDLRPGVGKGPAHSGSLTNQSGASARKNASISPRFCLKLHHLFREVWPSLPRRPSRDGSTCTPTLITLLDRVPLIRKDRKGEVQRDFGDLTRCWSCPGLQDGRLPMAQPDCGADGNGQARRGLLRGEERPISQTRRHQM